MSRPTPKRYPYIIPPLDDVQKVVSRTRSKFERWQALEFFRIECLLRSQTVIELYKQQGRCEASERVLQERYQVRDGWKILDGAHHQHILRIPADRHDSMRRQFFLGAGMLNMGYTAQHSPETFAHLITNFKKEHFRKRHLLVAIDAAYKPHMILHNLKRHLTAMHKNISVDPSTQAYSSINPSKNPPLKRVSTWLEYCRAYDLRTCKGKTFSSIAAELYGSATSSAIDRAEKAFTRFAKLIRAAESQDWPPRMR